MSLAYSRLAAEVVANLAWPVVGLTGLLLFKGQVRELFKRLKGGEIFGVKGEFQAPELSQGQQQPTPSPDKTLAKNSQFDTPPPPSALYEPIERPLMATSQAISDASIREAWLVRTIAMTEINRRHETNYRLIFGSQIAALKQLNITGEKPAEQFRPFYEQAAQKPEWQEVYKAYSWEQWGNFLVDTGYVEFVPERPENVRMTLMGADFLHWMLIQRLPEAKAG